MTAYLLTLGLSYFLAGVLVAMGAARLLDAASTLLSRLPDDSLAAARVVGGLVLLAAGAVMLIRARRTRDQPPTGALLRWREHAMTAGSVGALVRLAVLAFAVEFALPCRHRDADHRGTGVPSCHRLDRWLLRDHGAAGRHRHLHPRPRP